MYDEGDNLEPLEETEDALPEEAGNNNFKIIGGILVLAILLSIGCIAYYGFVIIPKQKEALVASQQTQVAEQVAIGDGLTASAIAAIPNATATFVPTATPPFAQETATASEAVEPLTATVVAANTQVAQAQMTITSLPTSTLLPDTGFFDDAGAPGLFVMALALVVVILLARRLRVSPAK
ncbi:MAG: hypothetical protein HY867_01590 [Chloroflexi bacterium]|nr:hypothetical protein [Chloroflexota bacterium]